ncbi:hypothetical protein [Schleiferia thermophila]|uniref:hypothetical protein n=1 Tax=Schleiferia thermophila TaxID=884107 RepID=UPI001362A42D|nr:hypothetical protein [Schleiferia thermophila]
MQNIKSIPQPAPPMQITSHKTTPSKGLLTTIRAIFLTPFFGRTFVSRPKIIAS